MKYFGIIFILALWQTSILAQICDDFSDANFTENPAWSGNSESFTINDDQLLQLDAAEGGTAFLSLPVDILQDNFWEFYFQMDFAPSTSNQLRIYLASDNPSLTAGNGYYLEIGATGSTDPISFFRQENGNGILLEESAASIVASDPVIVRMKVSKNSTGDWNLNADLSGGKNFTNLFTINDANLDLTTNQFFGFHCKFSETRKDKFSFDDICVGDEKIDNTPNIEPYDLLITEIMADPSPPVGLPAAEYIEIYNNSNAEISLDVVRLMVGSSSRNLPNEQLASGAYALLIDADDLNLFDGVAAQVIPLSLPTIPNTGAPLTLINEQGVNLHYVFYTDDWYRDNAKDDGGWSLEMVNINMVCTAMSNWRAADNLLGGTPGQINSVQETEIDDLGPILQKGQIISSTEIILTFDEVISAEMMTADGYSFSPARMISSVARFGENQVRLNLSEALEPGVTYSLTVNTILDCLENPNDTPLTVQLGLPAIAMPGDLLISEILFNPRIGGVRYLEVLNVSDKIFDAQSLVLGEIFDGDIDLEAVGESVLILPGRYYIFTEGKINVQDNYTVPFPDQMIEASLPSWDSKVGNATLLSNGIVIDSFNYFSTYHSSLLDDENGVALERISFQSPTNDDSIWKSAAESVGFGTPTGPNSQAFVNNPSESLVSLSNSTFTPDQDGDKDFLGIQINPSASEAVVSITIYDANGRRIVDLIRSQSVAGETIFTWDGTNMDGQLERMGMYIVYVNIFDANGNTEQVRKTCVLAKQLN